MTARKSAIDAAIADDARGKVVAHCIKGQIVWIVRDTGPSQYIECVKLNQENGSWVHQFSSEADGPKHYNCPPKYLDMVLPGTNPAWRENVRKHSEAKQMIKNQLQKAKVGDKIILRGVIVPYVFIRSLKPLEGSYGRTLYKVSIRHIQEIEHVQGKARRFKG